MQLTYSHFNSLMGLILLLLYSIVLPDLAASVWGAQRQLSISKMNLGSSKSEYAIVCIQRHTTFWFSLAFQRIRNVRENIKILDAGSIPPLPRPSQLPKAGWSMLLLTHLHESPVVVHLLGSLEKVAPISPHGCMLFRDDGCA